ncbi:hypothetical protein PENSPDRAFT_736309 [Peniophora sp. CONT]|nr:hypothetical protein PENSPDRAFT_736309 [Peniophora sp. CONT]
MSRIGNTTSYIGPITCDGDFYYSGDTGLFVKVEGDRRDRRYYRADPRRLYSQATGFSKEKDESVAYYTAQLMLYGLKPKRTRPLMKKVLLDAFGEGRKLEVPWGMRRKEEDIKSLWNARNEERHRKICERREMVAAKEAQKDIEERRRGRDAAVKKEDVEETAPKAETPRKRKAVDDGSIPASKKARIFAGRQKLLIQEVEGNFTLSSPTIEEDWDAHSGLKLILAVSSGTGSHLWGSFSFGRLTGIIRGSAPPKTVGDTAIFNWRGYDKQMDQMFYISSCKGTLTFLENGRIRGTIKGGTAKKYAFTGTHDGQSTDRYNDRGFNVERWKCQWRGINEGTESAAQYAQMGFWSGGKSDVYQERPAESDTTSDDDGESSDDD